QYLEESCGSTVQFTRAYRMEVRLFVLATTSRGTDVALLTVLRQRELRAPAQGFSTPPPPIAHLAQGIVDGRGRVLADKQTDLSLPLNGPPACECGAFVEVPGVRVSAGQGWEASEAGRPLRLWRVAGPEMINGSTCVKLLGVQQS